MKITLDLEKDQSLFHFTDNCILAYASVTGNTLIEKVLTEQSFTGLLSGSLMHLIEYDRNFTRDFSHSNLVSSFRSDTQSIYNVVIPKGKYMFNFDGNVRMVHYPNLLFHVRIDKNLNSVTTRIFALKDEDILYKEELGTRRITLSKKTTLFIYPFGNVSEKGDVCWGSNIVKADSDDFLYRLIDTFMHSPTNFHNTKMNDKLYLKFIKKLEKKAFDDSELNASNCKLNDLV